MLLNSPTTMQTTLLCRAKLLFSLVCFRWSPGMNWSTGRVLPMLTSHRLSCHALTPFLGKDHVLHTTSTGPIIQARTTKSICSQELFQHKWPLTRSMLRQSFGDTPKSFFDSQSSNEHFPGKIQTSNPQSAGCAHSTSRSSSNFFWTNAFKSFGGVSGSRVSCATWSE